MKILAFFKIELGVECDVAWNCRDVTRGSDPLHWRCSPHGLEAERILSVFQNGATGEFCGFSKKLFDADQLVVFGEPVRARK